MAQDFKQIIKREYLKCVKDPIHFMRKYCVIQHPIRGKIPFELYPFQVDTLKEVLNHKYNIILKARQLGFSWTSAAYAAWLVTFYPGTNVLMISKGQTEAFSLLDKVRFILKNLPQKINVY